MVQAQRVIQTTYDGTAQSVSGFTATGLVNGETVEVLSDVASNGGTGTDAGSYPHTLSGTDGNYNLTFKDGSLTIAKADATLTANGLELPSLHLLLVTFRARLRADIFQPKLRGILGTLYH